MSKLPKLAKNSIETQIKFFFSNLTKFQATISKIKNTQVEFDNPWQNLASFGQKQKFDISSFPFKGCRPSNLPILKGLFVMPIESKILKLAITH